MCCYCGLFRDLNEACYEAEKPSVIGIIGIMAFFLLVLVVAALL